ncbi:carboxypeptidase-like regulatory domain-containing protein [Aureivirga sp. CE67]|uniref:carboxypeptidase-like regulatory domain-containing protein n=1 Tax=Aureivirga sp. CE67 TaxID=1788983 RepID=UPI0018C997DA|nr:carboxypeptidase-like regulatory domain-containing protein [Aureivirga sp. CE67]
MAQTFSGYVLDKKTKKPIENVTVYFTGTTLGDATDENGYYEIDNKFSVKANLLVSVMGYQKVLIEQKNIKPVMKIYLEEEIETNEAVTINAVKVKRDHTLRIFKEEFLGKHHDSPYLKILNEHKIKFNITSDSTLIARCDEPIIIENKRLGYKMKYDLITFEAKLYLRRYPYNVGSVNFAGFCFFNDLKNLKKKHFKRRREAYLGSKLHFFRSLVRGDFEEHKFNFTHNGITFKNPENFIQKKQRTEETTVFELQEETIAVLYNNDKQSILEIREKDKTFSVDSFGNISPPNKVLFGGEMSFKRVGEMLPLDFQLEN